LRDPIRLASILLGREFADGSRRHFLERLAVLVASGGVSAFWLEASVQAKKKKSNKKKPKKKKKNPTGGSCGAVYAPDAEEQAFLGRINAHRGGVGVAPLALQYQLGAAAKAHAASMASSNSMYHNPDVRAFQVRCGYVPRAWGENIASGYETANEVFDGWKNSPPHNQNMLDPGFADLGVGRAFSATTGWYWSTEFGRR
jgi:uncharacterized protein YkwD